MPDRAFFYGTLMSPFNRDGRQRIAQYLAFAGRGSIQAALFDLGIYPAAVPAADSQVWGELFDLTNSGEVLAALDEIEGYRDGDPESSLYTRVLTTVTLEDGRRMEAWAYFYNAPLGAARRVESGDYLEYLRMK
jgi:gamma-glutamylcyclotransferase (GGCT)/AIG2-like uncharacterized protein YtfP